MIQENTKTVYQNSVYPVSILDKYPDKYITDIEYEVINRGPGTLKPIVRDIAKEVIALSVSGLGFVLKFSFMSVYALVSSVFFGVHKFSRQTDKRTRQKPVHKSNVIVNVYVNVQA